MLSLKQANSPRDCFRILKDAKLFTSADVIFIQYLLKKMDCTELFEKCCEYAEAQKALCFYEKPPGTTFRTILRFFCILTCSFNNNKASFIV